MLGLLLVGLAAYALWPAPEDEAAAPERQEAAPVVARVQAVVVQPGVFSIRSEATGRLAPWTEVAVSAEASGVVTRRSVEEGMWVDAGAPLFYLDDREARIALEEAEANLLTKQADFAVGYRGSDARRDTAALGLARRRLAAAEDAHAAGTLTDDELRTVQREARSAEIRHGPLRGDVAAATYGLSQAEQAVSRARLNLDRAVVRAPVSGRVADVEVEAGQRVTPGQPLLTLLDDRRMKVTADVLEPDLVQLRRGAAVRVRVPALADAAFRGTIHAVNPLVDPVTGTGRVTLAVPNSGRQLMAGLYAYAELETEQLPDRLAVPAEAVLVRQGRDLVFRIAGGRAEWVYVTTGARSVGRIEIVDGLSPGDTVAVGGHFALAHDAPAMAEVVLEGQW